MIGRQYISLLVKELPRCTPEQQEAVRMEILRVKMEAGVWEIWELWDGY